MLRVVKMRVVWPDPSEPRATLIRVTPRGEERERTVGPRTLLTLDEAAAVLDRSRADVRRSIRAGFLRPVRRGGRDYVTMQACRDYRRELLADLAIARDRSRGPRIPATEVFRETAN
jgi:hypothetical protein